MEGKVNNKFSNLPAGWEVKTVEQIFDFYPTASYSRDKMFDTYNPTAIGYIHYGDIHTKYSLILDVPNAEIPYISEELKKDFEYIKEGDLILSDTSEDYEGVGKCIEILNVGSNKIISGLHTLMLRQKGNDLIDGFKGYLFSGEYVRNSLLRIVTGIKVYSIAKAMLAKVDLPIPSIQEQKEITTILSKVDEAIASVQNSIAAAERLKKSLMQNLLTGKMKPDGTFRTSKEFYIDEKFGKVPVGWEVKRVDDLALRKTEVIDPTKTNEVFDYIGLEHIISNEFERNGKGMSNETVALKVKFEKGDILYGKLRPYLNKVLIADISGVGSTEFIVLGRNEFTNWVYLNFQLRRFLDFTKSMTAGTQHPRVSWNDIKRYPIYIPKDIHEMNLISDKIVALESFRQSQQQKIKKTERLKKSLMQNLLTGKIVIANQN